MCYTNHGATSVREVGQGRNPAALSEFGCVLFFVCSKNPLKSGFQRGCFVFGDSNNLVDLRFYFKIY